MASTIQPGCASGAVAAVLIFYARVLPDLAPAAEPSELPPYWPVEIGAICVCLATAWAIGTIVRWKRLIAAPDGRW